MSGVERRAAALAPIAAVALAAASLAPAARPLGAQQADTARAPRFTLEVEGGAVWQGYNDAEVPNDGTATRFSLSDLIGGGPWPAGRAYLTWHVAERHGLRLLVAPLTVRGTGTPDAPLRFAGETYVAGAPVEARYTFDSYRLTYRYRVHAGARTTAWVGATAKVRDATIALEQGETRSRTDDVGFVPLLHLAGDLRLAPRWRLSLDADALAGGPGRAIDAALTLGYDPGGAWAVEAGYRTLEGGADVDEVYSFAWLHYAVASVSWRW